MEENNEVQFEVSNETQEMILTNEAEETLELEQNNK